MGRFNFDVEDDSTPTPEPQAPSSQRMRLDYTPDEPVETEGGSMDAPISYTPIYEPDTESASRPDQDEDDDALIDQATREKIERAKSVTLDAAKVAGKHSRQAAQVSARLAKAGAGMAKDQVSKALAYRPSASMTCGALALAAVSTIAALGYGAWHHWPESTDSAPAPVAPAPAKAPEPKQAPPAVEAPPSEPVADPADVLAGELGASPVVPPAPAPVAPATEQAPEPAKAPPKAAQEKAPAKPKQAAQPAEKAKPKTEKASDKEWAEKANAQLDGFFEQLNEQQEPKK